MKPYIYLSSQTDKYGNTVGTLSIIYDCNLIAQYTTLENHLYQIKQGEYNLTYSWSPKFKRHLWSIHVPERKGIRIHVGNTIEDSSGCPLIGSYFSNQLLHYSSRTLSNFHATMRPYNNELLKIKIIRK
jgi:hypothetical protein